MVVVVMRSHSQLFCDALFLVLPVLIISVTWKRSHRTREFVLFLSLHSLQALVLLRFRRSLFVQVMWPGACVRSNFSPTSVHSVWSSACLLMQVFIQICQTFFNMHLLLFCFFKFCTWNSSHLCFSLNLLATWRQTCSFHFIYCQKHLFSFSDWAAKV